MAGIHCVVIDTNVFAVAEGMHDGASEECVLACVRVLRKVEAGERVGADVSDLVLGEYLNALRGAQTSGVGKKLALFLWRQRFDTDVCHRVPITALDDPEGSFAEVPEALRDFDTDDQKFLAVAMAGKEVPPVFQALDDEWWERRTDLADHGFDVQFLCIADSL